ncbi:adenylate/guanylate cyclase domain-containing protein [Brevibacterium litoralis]|uniref:adenylate/guanylate cyclase domain-containing protein n=1 Tax=Brevibacterium litoralis TaxID=3138935 RepID=UPI0032EF7776
MSHPDDGRHGRHERSGGAGRPAGEDPGQGASDAGTSGPGEENPAEATPADGGDGQGASGAGPRATGRRRRSWRKRLRESWLNPGWRSEGLPRRRDMQFEVPRWAAAEGMMALGEDAPRTPTREEIESTYDEVRAKREEMANREEAARLAALEKLRSATTGEVPVVADAPDPGPEGPRGPVTPEVAADALTEEDRSRLESTVAELREAAEHLESRLLGGDRVLTRAEVAGLADTSVRSARQVWRALGFPRIPEGQKAYTASDVEALRDVVDLTRQGDLLDDETALTLARAIGQTSDRLVVWQMEALVEYLTESKGLGDVQARAQAVDLFEGIIDPLEDVLVYAWRRNLSNALGRLGVNVPTALAMENRQGWYDSSMPLARAIGFADLVSYTRLAQQMEPKELAAMVKRFQNIVYNVVATGGGRVIKTIGDEVFYAAETPHAGAEIALTLSERLAADELMPRTRVGFAWGKVLSRMGDIFGSTVNLAARLVAVAEPGTVLTDWDTAHIIAKTDDYVFSDREEIHLKGLGDVGVVRMSRGTATPLSVDI